MPGNYKTLRLILGDQLNEKHSWFRVVDEEILYVITELRQETDYVKHHVQKICAFFTAMENFSKILQRKGHHVLHFNLDDTAKFSSLPELIQELCRRYRINTFEYQRPDEYRLSRQLSEISLDNISVSAVCDTEHFILPFDEIPAFFKPGKRALMENFYRKMRVRLGILMDNGRPLGSRWNFDTENRKKLKPAEIEVLPKPLLFRNDVSDILERLERNGVNHFGQAQQKLIWPVTRRQALRLLDHFCSHCLKDFGRFQDAMTKESSAGWSLYHSRLSFALNAKLIDPLEVIERAITQFEKADSSIDLAQIEGFVRQILGWREFVRGIYWANMPQYAQTNRLSAKSKLPGYFWTGKTKMECMKHAIVQSLDFAYAHHIQRLMVTGNFCLLTGIDPNQVDSWYLGIYIDAIEWVEMPNTRGMSQFADGGILATKPYAASGSYINKMSDYCQSCYYKVKERETEKACPFNSLYWLFMERHRKRLGSNQRLAMAYRSWEKMDTRKRNAILKRGETLLSRLDDL